MSGYQARLRQRTERALDPRDAEAMARTFQVLDDLEAKWPYDRRTPVPSVHVEGQSGQ